ncbi:hypothetical protein EXIGLDRAFT_680044 [Exidia glandulosa HHB12029]|uniref:RRM domain-containing protein n=1 Tax=Exidia glandulosa HHB12029 TaxID=1314781 RepID=A0A165ENN3_EXIGL|nr:hypothetical protein EXIGLDRAFT_680044 [Exidia glandulosa HHB12029]
MTATTATSVGGFTILPLRYSSSATHNIYVRAHAGSRPKGVPEGRALFLVNVPPDATEHELSTLFSSYGTVEKVLFSSFVVSHDELEGGDDDDEDVQDDAADDESESSSEDEHPRKKRKLDKGAKDKKKKPTAPPRVEPLLASSSLRTLRPSGSSAHLVFLDPSSLQRALSSLPPPKPPAWPAKTSNPEPSGLSYYAARHAALRPPLSTVLTHAESAILAYDWKLEKQKRIEKSKYKKGEEIVDEDGFTLVVRGGAYGQSVGGGVGVASKRFELAHNKEDEEAAKKKKKKKEKEGFYAFQVREKNLKEHAELRRKFEEDKKKVEEMQKKRAFVPY